MEADRSPALEALSDERLEQRLAQHTGGRSSPGNPSLRGRRSGRSYEFVYVCKLPSVTLRQVALNKRTLKLPEGNGLCAQIGFRFWVRPAEPPKFMLFGRVTVRLATDTFKDAIDDLARHVLGVDEGFRKLIANA